MKWFGEDWGAEACIAENHVDTPVGESCVECDLPIDDGDIGVVLPYHGSDTLTTHFAYHHVCFMRTILPCERWTEEMLEDLPDHWAAHRRAHHK
jgi:hypothetical protein